MFFSCLYMYVCLSVKKYLINQLIFHETLKVIDGCMCFMNWNHFISDKNLGELDPGTSEYKELRIKNLLNEIKGWHGRKNLHELLGKRAEHKEPWQHEMKQ